MLSSRLAILSIGFLFLAGCASSTYKARQEQREKVAQQSGLFCEFVNGEQHTDLDVELNFQMAKRCEPNRPFTITNYKNSSEMFGIVYCCQLAGYEGRRTAKRPSRPAPAARPAPKVETPAAEATKSEPTSGDSGDEISEE